MIAATTCFVRVTVEVTARICESSRFDTLFAKRLPRKRLLFTCVRTNARETVVYDFAVCFSLLHASAILRSLPHWLSLAPALK